MAHHRYKSASRAHANENGETRPFSQFWSGTITFGLVSVPVRMFPAHRSKRAVLHEIDTDGTPLRRRFFCPEEKRIVPSTQIVRGFEVKSGKYVTVSDAELEALEPQKSREIDLRLFVDHEEISPLFFERAYYLGPDGESNKAYRLLAQILEKTKRAGIATFVMHDRAYVVAITGDRGILRGQTLRFRDEIRQPSDLGLSETPDIDRRLSARFERAIETQSKDRLDTRELRDTYTESLKKLVEKKRKRRQDVVDVGEEPADAGGEDGETEAGVDLLETIRRSLNLRSSRGHLGNGSPSRDGDHASARKSPKHSAKSAAKSKTSKPTRASRSSSAGVNRKRVVRRRGRSNRD